MKGFSQHFKKAELTLDPGRTAVIVVDIVNDFMKEGGKMPLPGGDVIMPYVHRVITAAEQAGSVIVYIKDNHRPDKPDREFLIREPHCIDGTWGAELVDELKPREKDYILKKRRFSSFFQTDLDLVLRECCIETVIVMGVVTNICVRSTVHDAFFNGYRCVVPEECVMATGPREQESTLWDIDTHFGWVKKTDEVLRLLGAA